MTRKKAIEILEAKIDCMEKQIEATCEKLPCDKCSLGHKQGNIVEQKEVLKLALKALQKDLYNKATILEKLEQAKRTNEHVFDRYNKYYTLSLENYYNDVDDILSNLIKEISCEGGKRNG